MSGLLADLDRSVLVVVDIQPTFLKPIWEADRVVRRSTFLLRAARELELPILATEQNPTRMGGTLPEIAEHLPSAASSKMAFSCAGCAEFVSALERTARRQVVLIGIETHICVGQTALELIERGYDVVIGEDAVSARTPDRHAIGMGRMKAAGAIAAHTESIVYEWLRTAEHPRFRNVLAVVKEFGD